MNNANYFLFFIIFLFYSCNSKISKTIIAHRGASGYLPEHTLEGVAMAHSFGVDYIEPDIVLTKDNQAVVIHDIHLDTTTNVKSIFPKKHRSDGRFYVIDFTLNELKQLKVNKRIEFNSGKVLYPNRFPNTSLDFKIPSLIEFIQLVQGLNHSRGKEIGIYVELKSPEFHSKEGKDIAKVVFEILKKYGYETPNSKAIIQCFYPPTLKRLREEFKTQIPLVLLFADNSWNESSFDYDTLKNQEGIKAISSYVNGVGVYFYHIAKFENEKYIKKDIVNWFKNNSLFIHVYTHRSDDLPIAMTNESYFNFIFNTVEVDGVFSDFSDIALSFSK